MSLISDVGCSISELITFLTLRSLNSNFKINKSEFVNPNSEIKT